MRRLERTGGRPGGVFWQRDQPRSRGLPVGHEARLPVLTLRDIQRVADCGRALRTARDGLGDREDAELEQP